MLRGIRVKSLEFSFNSFTVRLRLVCLFEIGKKNAPRILSEVYVKRYVG